ncbi:hypothetical protein BRC81_12765 [Halobacteriales archaeon QS_1_68_20]|nr:MAG: hypothetical protein BRC81_12765 [Halobacteriales archaeon QS_1_68_20]
MRLNRRELLKKGSATATFFGIGAGATSGASTKKSEFSPSIQEARSKYASTADLSEAVTEHGQDLVSYLRRNRYLDDGEIVDHVTSGAQESTAGDVVVDVIPTEQGWEPLITMRVESPARDVRMYVNPQSEDAYAIVEDEAGKRIVDPDRTSGEVSVESVCTECYAPDCKYDSDYDDDCVPYHRKIYCCDSYCYWDNWIDYCDPWGEDCHPPDSCWDVCQDEYDCW